MSQAENDLIAAFIAKRGVTRVPVGEAALGHLSGRDWRAAVRAPRGVAEVDPSTQRRVAAIDHLGREVWVNGHGEWIATE
jgi:hypothetical protein